MPELPEVESLAAFLRERAVGEVIERAEVAAISVLKTYRPDLYRAALARLDADIPATDFKVERFFDD